MADSNDVNTENTFVPNDNLKAVCKLLKITIGEHTSYDSLLAEIKNIISTNEDYKGYKIENGELVMSGGATISLNEQQNTKSDEENDNKQPTNKNDDAAKDINVDGEKPTAPTAPSDENSDKLEDWVKNKISYYQGIKAQLEEYELDKGLTDSFGASFNGGHIHYSDKDNVTVSKESGLSVFEVLVSEPDNKGRTVNFGPNLDHAQAVKLLAACLLHDNQLGTNTPQLSPEDIRSIETELKDRPDDLQKFQEKIAPYTQSVQQNTDSNEDNQPTQKESREDKIMSLREKLAQRNSSGNSESNDLLEHDKRILALSGRLDENDKAYYRNKKEVKTLSGDRLEKFKVNNQEAIARALENYEKNHKSSR